jgi:outer membrane immunogenic protein
MLKFIALLATLVTGPALAADMPVKAALTGTPVPTWQGLYVGLQGGWNLGSFNPLFGTGKDATAVNLDDNSPFVGGHIGYLVQNGAFVLGPEFGVQYWGMKSQAQVVPAVPATIEAAAIPAILLQQKIDWLAYANVRAGLSPAANWLVYLTGGAAWAHVKGDLINVSMLSTAFEQSVMGWNVGAGLELKLTEYLTLGAEYRHYDFGKVQSLNPALLIGLGGVDSLTVDQVMGRLSYRLN